MWELPPRWPVKATPPPAPVPPGPAVAVVAPAAAPVVAELPLPDFAPPPSPPPPTPRATATPAATTAAAAPSATVRRRHHGRGSGVVDTFSTFSNTSTQYINPLDQLRRSLGFRTGVAPSVATPGPGARPPCRGRERVHHRRVRDQIRTRSRPHCSTSRTRWCS